MTQRVVRILLALVAGLLVVGCATTGQGYEGERLEGGKVAVLRVWSMPAYHFSYTVMVQAYAIDGKATPRADDLELLPGPHVVALRVAVSSPLLMTPFVDKEKLSFEPPRLAFTAEAGRRYKIAAAEAGDKHYVAWIEDEQGTVVAGRKPATAGEPAR